MSREESRRAALEALAAHALPTDAPGAWIRAAIEQELGAPSADATALEHGYGVTSDCLCGRNFATVRGLREHLTKARP